MPVTRPFKRMRLADVPEKPRLAHDFFDVPPKKVRMNSAVFGQLSVNYHVRGEGAPLLLIHGMMTTSYSFRYLVSHLSKRHTLYIPDLPGAGRSDKPLHVAYTAENFAQWIIEFQKAVGIYGCDCVGNSMGGYYAMHAAMADHECFSRLVNIHSPVMPMMRFRVLHAALSIPGTPALIKNIIALNPVKWVHRNIHYYDESLKSLEEAHEYGDPLTSTDGAYAFHKFLLDTFDPGKMQAFVEKLRALNGKPFPIPLTLIYAEQDPMVPPRVGKYLSALLPGATMIWMKNTSHFAHVDTPAEVGRLIEEAIAS